jgi:hypothetical protein
VLSTLVHLLCGFVLTTKLVAFMRYVYFIEGAVFVVMASVLAHLGGITAIIATSIACTCLFSLPYGIWRTQDYFKLSSCEILAEWMLPPMRFLLILGPLATIVWYASSRLDYPQQILLQTATVGCLSIILLLRYGLHQELKTEIRDRAPKRVRPVLTRVMAMQNRNPI